MEELNKKIAEWVGFKEVTVRARAFDVVRGKKKSWETCERRWLRPNCEFEDKLYPSYYGVPFVEWELPHFTTSLDACFKYVVPKLMDILLRSSDKGFRCVIWQDNERYIDEDKTPALAFCKAVEKLIDKEQYGRIPRPKTK